MEADSFKSEEDRMKFDLDLKTLVMIISTACVLAGFYYTTQARLDVVEHQIQDLQEDTKRLNRLIRSMKKGQK
jgi:hypothetical protein